MKKNIFMYLLVCKGLPNDGVGGVARGAVFQEIRPGVGFKTGDFVWRKVGGGYHKTSLKLGTIFYVVNAPRNADTRFGGVPVLLRKPGRERNIFRNAFFFSYKVLSCHVEQDTSGRCVDTIALY